VYQILCAGFGGQGILFLGDMLAQMALRQGLHVTYLPTYGVAMRGGTANCAITLSEEEVGCPLIDQPQAAILMNQPSMDKFQPIVAPGGLIVANTSLVAPETFSREADLRIVWVAATELARQATGSDKAANMIVLGAFLGAQDTLHMSVAKQIFGEAKGGKRRIIEQNLAALDAGQAGAREHSAARTQ
jgi:2-oxoglutarate ferredoxin oxidoreductase subunit gamma